MLYTDRCMKTIYDQETDTLTLIFSEDTVTKSDHDIPALILDYNAAGDLVSLEVLDASCYGFSILDDMNVAQVRELLAIYFYKEHALSLGQATRLAGYTYWSFVDLLSANDVPVLDYTDEELEAEFDAVARLDDSEPMSLDEINEIVHEVRRQRRRDS